MALCRGLLRFFSLHERIWRRGNYNINNNKSNDKWRWRRICKLMRNGCGELQIHTDAFHSIYVSLTKWVNDYCQTFSITRGYKDICSNEVFASSWLNLESYVMPLYLKISWLRLIHLWLLLLLSTRQFWFFSHSNWWCYAE